ncbi:MAG: hypothetical protein J7641_16505 [Cyanobacteria bacterium SID2]|nr:hypothetical protein [Cyanobacteria bacterium SID2]MBP0004864.1 hypothetical protein [Cyanobacteria bacterium SBC]
MTVTNPKISPSAQYSDATLNRARRAVRCAPFQLPLYTALRDKGVFLGKIAGMSGVQAGYIATPIPELSVEDELLWLISVGVLRREVDGQGITDSFRLTPLGRLLVREWQESGAVWTEQLTAIDRLTNSLRRWFHLPL